MKGCAIILIDIGFNVIINIEAQVCAHVVYMYCKSNITSKILYNNIPENINFTLFNIYWSLY